jgi:aminopeptidase N
VGSTYLVTATAEGFWQPEQQVLLTPFLDRYFAAVVDVAARRGATIADAVAGAGFPYHAVAEATLRAADSAAADQLATRG